ncbi:hypothetical protein CEP88_18150 [Roseobacter denitrificans]|uniref:Uncharacterized protein n=1 Tax=Roseobacter denitrificans (strain ATCC 33942 / OCh 114) TaxID=375451 RepID=Q169Q6_ROSDO|nr:hypothetical protein RD1_1662 [Roseobacter denitrificans OCh 114]AVL54332.1 hypothetical protein CEP88_18150 [Roseobacter denitrificans]
MRFDQAPPHVQRAEGQHKPWRTRPDAPQEARYPRSFGNTTRAFLIFTGNCLMVFLTASILTEQVTS